MRALGLELPTFPSDPIAASNWCAAAAVAADAGFDALWLQESTVVAGSLAGLAGPGTLGIVSEVGPVARHPSVLARDVTAVDVLSKGRCALLLRGNRPEVEEAVAVCQLVFAGTPARFSGKYFSIEGAVNKPTPAHRLPVLAEGTEPVDHADGWVISGSVADVAACRREAPRAMPLVWRGSIDRLGAAEELFDAGADGLIVSVDPTPSAVRAAGLLFGRARRTGRPTSTG